MTIWAVGTTNRAKVESVVAVVNKCFPGDVHEVRAVSVQSGVTDQPMSAEETQKGCINRAKAALEAVPDADFGVGLEGGLEHIDGRWFECGWMGVVERKTGKCGIGSSARFEMSETLMRPILQEGKELAEVMDALTGETDVRSGLGAMGVLTAGHLGRAAAYEHGLIFALAPFLSETDGIVQYGEVSEAAVLLQGWNSYVFALRALGCYTFLSSFHFKTSDAVLMFTLVGVGLGDATDITLKGMNAVKEADIVFLEAYTSFLINSNAEELTGIYGKPVIVADREMVESGVVLDDAKEKKVVLLVVGDVFGATTHSDLIVRCHEQGIESRVVHNASIINAVGCCGLQLYRFGQVISLCFWTETWRPDSWYDRLKSNRAAGIHTLVLLDIKVKEISDENLARGRKIYEPARYMTIKQAVEQLLEVESYKQGGAIAADGSTFAVGVARVGSATQKVVSGSMKELLEVDFGEPLHSLVVAGDVHECEQEHVDLFRLHQ